jgi:hypothetical protein
MYLLKVFFAKEVYTINPALVQADRQTLHAAFKTAGFT